MGLRSEILSELVREVLGPRGGPCEILDCNPLNEYITGVLQPVNARTLPQAELDAQADVFRGEDVAGEEDLDEIDISPPVFSPALDPRSRPSSIGVAFRLEVLWDGAVPEFDLCVTWARYRPAGDSGGGVVSRWRREPRVWTGGWVGPEGWEVFLDGSASPVADRGRAEVSVRVRAVREESPRVFRVSVYLINCIQADAERIRAEDCIFQPQIRIACRHGTVLRPVDAAGHGSSVGGEEARLDFLYRNRPVMARGYLVGAVWRDVDPERPSPDGREMPGDVPFVWVDGQLLGDAERRRFSPADVRTEFVPVYSVCAPEFSWEPGGGREPELDARVLSEVAADPQRLRQCLQPLYDGYRAWIARQEREAQRLSGDERGLAGQLLAECQEVLQRLGDGLNLLEENPDVRVSFAFACRAMWLQARWAGRETMQWRPFQLAFVLMNIEPVVNPCSRYRNVCDLLWIPTGGGKTEAYLALAAFTLAFRRRRALGRQSGERTGSGTAVISRYTLRLLTIQQYRRALRVIAACERLRVDGLRNGGPVGWRPPGWSDSQDFLWGTARFSIGLWVGGNLRPNRVRTQWLRGSDGKPLRLPGALDILRGEQGEGEPAQIVTCPACGAVLALPEGSLLREGEHVLHLVVVRAGEQDEGRHEAHVRNVLERFGTGSGFAVTGHSVRVLPSGTHSVLTLNLRVSREINGNVLDAWWNQGPGQELELASFRASRPGYFAVRHGNQEVDFEIWCPAPECPLAEEWWCEGVPSIMGAPGTRRRTGDRSGLIVRHPRVGRELCSAGGAPDGMYLRQVLEPWRVSRVQDWRDPSCFLACRIPVPALTVDEQLYRRPPSMIVATADKFARLPFEPRAAVFFGTVAWYHPREGYLRENPGGGLRVEPLDPPDLILQDELHLLEGPLGSLAGLYEVVVDELCRNAGGAPVKYVAATATIREAVDQVRALFNRECRIFPPPGLSYGDRFFLRVMEPEAHPVQEERPGQLYVGICAPGWGAHTPVVRVWACLLREVRRRRSRAEADYYWTLTGYFNAIRELAGARALYRQDIPERLSRCGGEVLISDDRVEELSSNVPSAGLPAVLERLEERMPGACDVLFATSMFGTGVDIQRLSLMVVHGQPKTCSAYIQATGRVGRRRGALVVVLYRAGRPRDLSHYEFFCGYHRQLHRHVEPVTVMPFAPGVLDLACGPVAVALLRNWRDPGRSWHSEQDAPAMGVARGDPEVQRIPRIMEDRAQNQPWGRRPPAGKVGAMVDSELDRWSRYALAYSDLRYAEYGTPSVPVVLGDPEHEQAGLPVVFEGVPRSLREVEETLGVSF